MGYKKRMSRNNIIAGAILVFLLLFGLTLVFGSAKVEADLIQRGNALLQKQGLGWVELSVDGRELLLTGTAPNRQEGLRALALIRSMKGAGGVEKQFEYAAGDGLSDIDTLLNRTRTR